MNRWYRLGEMLVETVDGKARCPDLLGYADDIDGWSGNKQHPDGAPFWVVRVSADEAVHDELEDSLTQGARALDNVPVEALNNMIGQNRDEDGWNRGLNAQR